MYAKVWRLAYATEQDSQVSWLATIGFAAFVKGMQLIFLWPRDYQNHSRFTSKFSFKAIAQWYWRGVGGDGSCFRELFSALVAWYVFVPWDSGAFPSSNGPQTALVYENVSWMADYKATLNWADSVQLTRLQSRQGGANLFDPAAGPMYPLGIEEPQIGQHVLQRHPNLDVLARSPQDWPREGAGPPHIALSARLNNNNNLCILLGVYYDSWFKRKIAKLIKIEHHLAWQSR